MTLELFCFSFFFCYFLFCLFVVAQCRIFRIFRSIPSSARVLDDGFFFPFFFFA